VPFTDPRFLFIFLPVVFACYFSLRALERQGTRLARWASGSSLGLLLGVSVAFVALLIVGDGRATASRTLMPLGLAVIGCHALAYAADRRRGQTDGKRPFVAALYVVQFPLLGAGPIVRYRDFNSQVSRRMDGMGAFAYGVRRIVTGLVKIVLVANILASTGDRIFALPAPKLTADAAWLAAVCASLQIYFLFGGYADIAIGLGRMLGFRYPENFRRPYTADSVREFWRRWNVTLITWLRDYLYLPIAGQDPPTLRLYVNIVAGFSLVGLWHGAGLNAPVWGVYFGSLLAIEAVGFGAKLERLPRAARHAYVLLAVLIGGVILRAETLPAALNVLTAMAGLGEAAGRSAARYFTPALWLALGLAAIGAGPLVPWISRWRVSVDAATTSLLMMMAATSVFIWRPVVIATHALRPRRAAGAISDRRA
jgi:alginate O-acetyltransferase complex protein AlgI